MLDSVELFETVQCPWGRIQPSSGWGRDHRRVITQLAGSLHQAEQWKGVSEQHLFSALSHI